MLYAGNDLDMARRVFERTIRARPRIRLTIRQRARVRARPAPAPPPRSGQTGHPCLAVFSCRYFTGLMH